MPKIEKLTAIKISHDNTSLLGIQLKLDNGLVVQSNFPVQGNDPTHDVTKAMTVINDIVAQIVEGLNPLRQKELDKMITELSAIHEQSALRANISLALSLTILKAAAALNNLDPVTYIRTIYGFDQGREHRPILVFTCIKNEGGTGAFKEFFVIPARSKSTSESLLMFRGVAAALKSDTPLITTHHEIMNTVQIELLEKQILCLGFSLHHDVYLGFKPDLIYDEQRGYRCTDMLQDVSANQMVEYYKELQTLYSPLIQENLFASHDLISLVTLHKEIGDQTILTVSSERVTTPVECRRYAAALPTAMLNLTHQSVPSVTQYIELIDAAKKADWKVMIDTNGCSDYGLLFALSAAAQVDFIKMDRCDLEIEKELSYVGQSD